MEYPPSNFQIMSNEERQIVDFLARERRDRPGQARKTAGGVIFSWREMRLLRFVTGQTRGQRGGSNETVHRFGSDRVKAFPPTLINFF